MNVDFFIDKDFKEALDKVKRTKTGKIVLNKIIEACRVNGHGFVPGDPYATAFNCGQKSIGLWLLSEIKNENTYK
ncbi:MAG: hypothetical protein IKA93_04075 [Elusimicrobiaceae bacterium]|nr:hypothetical protein [Elusimicrobiaceae bacterium]